ncbi:hypothetical protein [Chromobacterium sp. ATCC 53434]|uniref:hypothetical protein n=1 Tax=Chromobacterium sp. (strain ATCC 53434 / SC 14030) TaxID=2059672 RepID=UPI00130509BD|nr:hypothetical protein [Chromobacterium sp. ATCC 53434]
MALDDGGASPRRSSSASRKFQAVKTMDCIPYKPSSMTSDNIPPPHPAGEFSPPDRHFRHIRNTRPPSRGMTAAAA